MELTERIVADLKTAMKARDELGKAVLRSIKSAIDKEVIDSQKELDEQGVITVIKRAHKQRKEAAVAYTNCGENERAAAELNEAELISVYLPEQMDTAEIEKHIDEVISATGAAAPSDQGKVMGSLAGILGGRADMKEVAQLVRSKLGS